MPTCEAKSYTWDNLDNAALNTRYLGDASTADWTYSGYPKTQDGNLLMTMPKNSVGTLFANNHYVWFGKVSGKIKSSRGQGVVTAFILLSDVKDEIDYEFVGADLTGAQTNYYWQGVLDCKRDPAKIDEGGRRLIDSNRAQQRERYREWRGYLQRLAHL